MKLGLQKKITFLTISAALVPVLFAFGGWQQSNFIAE